VDSLQKVWIQMDWLLAGARTDVAAIASTKIHATPSVSIIPLVRADPFHWIV
jgi:hypothetical protein